MLVIGSLAGSRRWQGEGSLFYRSWVCMSPVDASFRVELRVLPRRYSTVVHKNDCFEVLDAGRAPRSLVAAFNRCSEYTAKSWQSGC